MTSRARIFEVMDAHETGDLRDRIAPLVQPAIFIRADKLADHPPRDGAEPDAASELPSLDDALDALPLGASRFGGIPDLPPGAAWPSREDVPMEFIAQIRLADAAGLDPLARLPAQGSLLFFYNSQWIASDVEDGPCGVVLFHAGADAELVRTPPPRVDYKGPYDDQPRLAPYVHGLAALAFEAYETVPVAPSAFIPPDLSDRWQDFAAYFGAEYEPTAPRQYAANHLLGYLDGQDYVDAHTTEDQVLLQVDSDDAADFQWGDCDRLYFILSKAELAARDFSRVRLYSQLG